MVPIIPPGILQPVFSLRILSPALVFVTTISLLSLRPQSSETPSPITSVVVATVVPRRASILALLSLISSSYFLDGAAFVVFTILDKFWPRHTGIEINTVIGVAAFAGLAALGSWKDVNGVAVWTSRRIKTVVALALMMDTALVVLLGLKIRDLRNGDLHFLHTKVFVLNNIVIPGPPPHIPETPPQIPLQELLHFSFPVFRVLLLVPLFASLSSPRVVYRSLAPEDNAVAPATDSTFLLPPGNGDNISASSATVGASEAGKYGTFRDPRSNLQASAPGTRPATPATSTRQGKVRLLSLNILAPVLYFFRARKNQISRLNLAGPKSGGVSSA